MVYCISHSDQYKGYSKEEARARTLIDAQSAQNGFNNTSTAVGMAVLGNATSGGGLFNNINSNNNMVGNNLTNNNSNMFSNSNMNMNMNTNISTNNNSLFNNTSMNMNQPMKQQNAQPSAGGLWGNNTLQVPNTNASTGGGGLFGPTPTQNSNSLFGPTSAPASGNLFNSQTNSLTMPGNQGGNLFTTPMTQPQA